jgi:serine/threonine protein kinase
MGNLSKHKLGPDEALEMAHDVCLAVKEIHAVGMAHRDIKPNNIFIQKDGSRIHAFLGDVGEVYSPGESPPWFNGDGGSQQYWPPGFKYRRRSASVGGAIEESKNEPINILERYKKQDFWALGQTLLENLSGRKLTEENKKNSEFLNNLIEYNVMRLLTPKREEIKNFLLNSLGLIAQETPKGSKVYLINPRKIDCEALVIH